MYCIAIPMHVIAIWFWKMFSYYLREMHVHSCLFPQAKQASELQTNEPVRVQNNTSARECEKQSTEIICFYYHRYECDLKRNGMPGYSIIRFTCNMWCIFLSFKLLILEFFFAEREQLVYVRYKRTSISCMRIQCETKNQSQSKWKTLTQQKKKTFTSWLNGTFFPIVVVVVLCTFLSVVFLFIYFFEMLLIRYKKNPLYIDLHTNFP